MRLLEMLKGFGTRAKRAAREEKTLHPHDVNARARLAQIRVSRRPMRWRLAANGLPVRVFGKRPMAAWKGEVTHG